MSEGGAYDCLVRVHVSASIGPRDATVHIDGHTVDIRYSGTRELRVRCGPQFVIAYSTWLRQHGEVELLVDVEPGKVTDIYYAPPHHGLAKGSIGLVPQRGKGLLVAVGGIAFLAGLTLYFAAAPLLADLVDRFAG
jgi:hypothetical protein